MRPADSFNRGHHPGAANIPLEEIDARVHELPPRARPVAVIDDDPARVEAALRALRERGFEAATAPPSSEPLVEGPARARLWEPNPFLAEALPEIEAALRLACPEGGGGRGDRRPRAIDIACGSGRDAVFLALAGWDVTAIDILPDALERAEDLARRSGVAIRAVRMDLERAPALEALGAFDLAVVVSYLWRPLFPAIRAAIAPGGFVLYETFLEGQAARFGKPSNPAHLLAPGELPAHFPGWEVVRAREGLLAPRRLAARLLARRPAAG